MFIKISTGIKLSTGEVVDGYYVDNEAKELIEKIPAILESVRQFNFTPYRSECNSELLKFYDELFKPHLLTHYKSRLLKALASFSKSFREWDLRCLVKTPKGNHTLIVIDAFNELVKEGVIEYRGSGWYRRKKVG